MHQITTPAPAPAPAALLAVALALAAGGAAAQPLLIDFNLDGLGNTLVSGQGFNPDAYAAIGVQITGSNPNNRPLNLFNTALSTGGDGDLRTGPSFGSPFLGNALIFQDVGVPLSNPDDDEDGGAFTFNFFGHPLGVSAINIAIIDLDENVTPGFSVATPGDPSLSPLAPTFVELLNPSRPGNNSVRVYSFALESPVTSFSVSLPDVSGAIGFLEFTPVVIPAGPTALALAGGLLALRRRR